MFGHNLAAMFSAVGMAPRDEDAAEPAVGKKRPLDPTSGDPRDILSTPQWARKQENNPRWLDHHRLVSAGLVLDAEEEKRRKAAQFPRYEEPTQEEIEHARDNWEAHAGLPHTKLHLYFDDSDSDGEDDAGPRPDKPAPFSATDDPDIPSAPVRSAPVAAAVPLLDAVRPAAEPAAEAPRQRAQFCLNRNCLSYRTSVMAFEQRWYGECCGLRYQPGDSSDPLALGEEEEPLGDEEEDDEELEKMLLDDPETAELVRRIRAAYSTSDASPDQGNEGDGGKQQPEEEEEEDEESEEESEEEDEVEFIENTTALLLAIREALNNETLEPFASLSQKLDEAILAYGEDKLDFATFKTSALETIKTIRYEFHLFRRQNRPPKTNIVIDGKTYDI
ncbi:hypothetical protein DIPPA_16028 [Diplonema papillatum]|nr:hypothetical protein DIPPA_16028 [Diplonema papillatum]